jgi:uncharacterized protein (DUF2062 family)
MLFKRRKPEPTLTRLRLALVPRNSMSRSIQYLKKRVLRLSATPHAIAAGVAAGAFASFTPLLGFHFLLAFLVAWLLRGNMVAAAFGTAVGNPLTFPLIFSASYRLGRWMLGGPDPDSAAPTPMLTESLMSLDVGLIWAPVLKPMLIGGMPLGLAAGFVIYVITVKAVAAFQCARRASRAARKPASPAVPRPVA